MCLFIESAADRADHLRRLVEAHPQIPDTTAHVLTGAFEDSMTQMLDRIGEQNAALAPAFVMIDPFGPRGASMRLIGRVLENARSECLVSFMYEPIRRFHKEASHDPSLDELFGTPDWRRSREIADESKFKEHVHGLFSAQLKRHGARYVVSFELWRGNRHVYTLYFATGNLKGCDLMKKSIWRVDPSGGFSFRGYAEGQLTLFETNTEPLAAQLSDHFGRDWVAVELLDGFVMSDLTPFHSGHLRQKTLRRLEKEGRIEVTRPNGGKGFAAQRGVRVRFS